MPRQQKSLTKKRGRPSGVTHSDFVGLRLPKALISSLDKWIKQQPDPRPSRSEAIRRALADWLTGRGLLKNRDDPEGTN
jgi:metal-responsive CopG/Arc/MetJ family transcriptional regulator